MKNLWKLALVSTLALLAACSNNSGSNQIPPSTFRINPSLTPSVSSIPDPEGGAPRPVGAMRGKSGHQSEFVLNELIISSDDTAKVEALAARYGGQVLRTISLEGAPKLHLVRVNPAPAVESQLAQDLRALVPDARSDLEFSSQEGLNLLATAAREGVSQNLKVSLNFLLLPQIVQPQDIARSTSFEASFDTVREVDRPDYDPNAFNWPYMNRGSPQDIGVAEAWRLLQAAGKLSNRVKIAVIDGGFARDHPDYPATRRIYGGADWGARNPYGCGGSPCPWHGTLVTQAAMAQPDNNRGVAGPAGPVAELMAVQLPAPDFFEFIRFTFITLPGLFAEGPRILNFSGAAPIDAVPGALLEMTINPILGPILSVFQPLLFASAGNSGANVDEEDCFIACWEDTLWVPCELPGFICVGGMGWNTTAKARLSNFGTKRDDSSVDIYGPFVVWGGPDPSDGTVRKVSGTSVASPFVAGVAALIWAANPDLPARRVKDLLFELAHTGGVHGEGGHQRRVNAFGAVSRALGNVPPFIRIERPSEGSTFSWRLPVSLEALTYDPDTSGTPSVGWSSSLNGNLGSGTSLTVNSLNLGNHRITATATSGGQSASASVNITIRNDRPTVAIVEPAGSTFCTNQPVTFRAVVSDPNNNASHPFPTGNVVWRVGTTTFGTGLTASRTFTSPGSYTVTVQATDDAPAPHTLSHSASLTITVQNCTNLPPTVNITNPASDLDVTPFTSDTNGYYFQITLQGNATDPEDGPLSGASLVWTTDRADVQPGPPSTGDQVLGTGTSVANVRLYTTCAMPYSGTVVHRITLTATDSAGNRVSRTRLITVRTIC
jgi:serine protease